jgi:hypothetical protein
VAEADASAREDSRGDSVHERAKSASLVVAIVTILVGADPLDIRNSSHLFRKVDYVAIGFWILAVLLFLGAQAFGEGTRGHRFDYGKVSLVAAVTAASLAGALTITAVGAKAFGKADDYDLVMLDVTSTEQAAFKRLCGNNSHLYGTIRTATINDELVVLKLSKAVLPPARPGCDEIRLPRSAIVTLVEHPCDLDPPITPEFCPPTKS